MIKSYFSLFRVTIHSSRIRVRFGSNKINDLIGELSDRINRDQVMKSEGQQMILKNYIELTEDSYLQNLINQKKQIEEKKGKLDPRIILMILPTLQKQQTIREHLLLLYPYLHLLLTRQLQLFYQYLLAHEIKVKPKLPPAKSLLGAQSLLTLLAQLYPKDHLVEWLAQVPLYAGQHIYLLSMGAFSIISQLSENTRHKHKHLIQRCLERIYQLWSGSNSQDRLAIILLALQQKLPFAERLIFQDYSINLNQIDGLKLGLLLIQLNSYIQTKYGSISSAGPKRQAPSQEVQIDEGINKTQKPVPYQRYVYNPQNLQQVKYYLQNYLLKVVRKYQKLDWKGIVKLHQIVRFFRVIKNKKLQSEWLGFSYKLFNFTAKKNQSSSLINLQTSQILDMVEALQHLKINKPDLLKQLLVILSDRLEEASPQEMVRLSKCLVTYVRLCEDYLIHFRQILQRRKYIFSRQDIHRLNQNFKRVHVLFPKPLIY